MQRRDAAERATIELPFSPPYDWEAMVGFLAARSIPGVEQVRDGRYARTFAIGASEGRLVVEPRLSRRQLRAVVHARDLSQLPAIERRLRTLFDLDADAAAIDARLAGDPRLAERVRERPGIRLPGAWDAFEIAVRGVLGQQISVAAATTLAGRLVAALGRPLSIDASDAADGPRLLFPEPEALVQAELTPLGLTRARASTLRSLAAAMAADPAWLSARTTLDETVTALCALPGIGPWTAQYLAMRGLHERDAFPSTDVGVLRAFEENGKRPRPEELLARAEAWRPWRGYAVVRLWLQPRPTR